MAKYKTLLIKMAFDGPTNGLLMAKANFDLLCDVWILLGLASILPLL
jgi:hypothetical protein